MAGGQFSLEEKTKALEGRTLLLYSTVFCYLSFSFLWLLVEDNNGKRRMKGNQKKTVVRRRVPMARRGL